MKFYGSMAGEYFKRLKSEVAIEFADLNETQQKHVCNVISNYLRKCKYDIYHVVVSSNPIGEEPGYYEYDKLTACNRNIYIRITVD